MKGDIMTCWCLGAGKIPPQKRNGPFADVIMCLDKFVRHEPLHCKWDKLVHLPLLAWSITPHQGHHVGHVLGQVVDVGNNMLVYQFQMMEPDGEFMGVTRGLIFEGHLLMYDPTYNVAEWVLICGMASDLLPTKESLAHELSNIMLLEKMNDTP